MGWRQGPNGPVYVDEGEAPATGTSPYETAIREANQPSADSPYAIALNAQKGVDGTLQMRPDEWPGWKWEFPTGNPGAGGIWSDAHDPTGHQLWLNNQGGNQSRGSGNSQLDAIAAATSAAQAERGTATDSIVDRYSAIQLDTGPADQARQAQERGLGMQQAIYDKAMAYDPRAETEAASKRAMAKSVAMARSGGGGAAARQAAQFQALQSSPAIQAESAAMANQENQRQTQIAAKAAGDYAQIATGTRSQDIGQAQAEVDTGINVANGISNAIGRDMQLTSEEAQFLGKMQLAFSQLDLDWAALDETTRANQAQEILRNAGLEQEWQMFQESQDVGFLDVVGAVVGTARAGVGTYAQGRSSGLW